MNTRGDAWIRNTDTGYYKRTCEYTFRHTRKRSTQCSPRDIHVKQRENFKRVTQDARARGKKQFTCTLNTTANGSCDIQMRHVRMVPRNIANFTFSLSKVSLEIDINYPSPISLKKVFP